MAWLDDNPPAVRQFRCPRRATPSGLVVVHTAESIADETAPDRGAENVANFIRTRTNFGSYHDLADSDSVLQLVEYSCEAFHDATGSNPHSYGVSAACQAAKWHTYSSSWRNATVVNMAKAAARYAAWVKARHGVTIPAQRVSRAESELRRPGFISHAERDPDRRSDPGAGFPWALFLDTFAALTNAAPPEDDMPLDAADLKAIQTAVHNIVIGRTGLTLGQMLEREHAETNAPVLARLDQLEAKVDALNTGSVPVAGKVHVAGDLFVTPPEEPT